MSCLTRPPVPTVLPQDLINYGKSAQSDYFTCVGSDNNGVLVPETNFINTWASGLCNYFLDNLEITVQQETMNFVLGRYYSQQAFTQLKYVTPEAEQNILDVCKTYVGSCEQTQYNMCGLCNSQQVSGNYGLIRFCGCVTPVVTGSQYEKIACTSLCDNSVALKVLENGVPQKCNQAVCVMDQLSIQAVNTTFSNTTITQICGNCIDQGCKCFIDVGLPNIAKTLGIYENNDTFTTYCPNSECYTIDGEITNPVPCEKYGIGKEQEIVIDIPKSIFWWILITFVILGLILASMYYWSGSFELIIWKLWEPMKTTLEYSKF